jgi:hypothetical protein
MAGPAIANSADAGVVHAEDMPETATVHSTVPIHPSQRVGKSCQCELHRLLVPQLHPSSKPQQQYRLRQLPRPWHLRLRQCLPQPQPLRLHPLPVPRLFLLPLPPALAPSPPPDADRHLQPLLSNHNHTHIPASTPNRTPLHPRTTTLTRRRPHRATALPVSHPTTVSATVVVSAKPHQSGEHTPTERPCLCVPVHLARRTATTTGPHSRRQHLHLRALVRNHTSSTGTGTTSSPARAPRLPWTTRTRMMVRAMSTIRRRLGIRLCVATSRRHNSSSLRKRSSSDGRRRLLCRRAIMRCIIAIVVIMMVIASNNNNNSGRTNSSNSRISNVGLIGANGAAVAAAPEAGARVRAGDM